MMRFKTLRRLLIALACMALLAGGLSGCGKSKGPEEIIVYCGVDEPYASEVFKEFEKQTGLKIAPVYDIESSKSVGLAEKLISEAAYPRADVWWGSEAFQSVRLTNAGILAPYQSPSEADILREFKDPDGYWTGVGVRARVLAVAQGKAAPPFAITSLQDLLDPRLKGAIAMSRPTAGATVAHVAALYSVWGPTKAADFYRKLHDNGVALLGGNAEVADQVGLGNYSVGITDSDDVNNAIANGGKITRVLPDQNGLGTLAMPTTVALVKGSRHAANAQKLIDFLLSKRTEQKLIDMKFAGWSVRAGTGDAIKAMKVDPRKAVEIYPQAQRQATAILDGRTP